MSRSTASLTTILQSQLLEHGLGNYEMFVAWISEREILSFILNVLFVCSLI